MRDRKVWLRSDSFIGGESKCRWFSKLLRETAQDRNIKLPKRIEVGGAYSRPTIYMCWSTLVMRDLIVEVANHNNVQS